MSVAGDWDITIEATAELGEGRLELRADGTALEGTLHTSGGPTPVSGRVEGDRVDFVARSSELTGAIALTFSGRFEGNLATGDVELGNYQRGTWTATRREAAGDPR